MERAAVSSFSPAAVVFSDGLGERHHILDPKGTETLEVLCLREDLAAVPSFEFALRERVSRLANFRHAYYGRIRAVERLSDRQSTLAIVSDSTPGIRLSDLLAHASERRLNFDINSALCLIRQLVPAMAALHESARDIPGLAHGALGPERLIVTPNARLMIVEYAMGAALEQLHFTQERYWQELRIATPRASGLARFDQRVDVTQIGLVALSLILGRLLREDEYPARVGDVVASTWAISARGGFEPLPPGLRGWLGRALQLDARASFATANEARAELEKVLGDSDFLASPASLEAFLAKHQASERPASGDAAQRPAAAPVDLSFEALPQLADPLPKHRTGPSSGPPPPPAPPLRPIPVAPAPGPAVEPRTLIEPVASRPLHVEPKTARLPKPAHDELSFEFHQDAGTTLFSQPPAKSSGSKRMAAIAVVLIALAGGGYLASGLLTSDATSPSASTGTLVITTNPEGVEAVVDGESRGVTPLTVTLSAGSHVVELRGGGEPRTIPVTITAGTQASQYIELQKAAPGPRTIVGQLQVRTEPAGARVTVDGTPRGVSPMIVPDLEPGEHTVVLESDLGSVKQTVTIESGATASLLVPLGGSSGAPGAGWVAVSAPVDVQIYESGRLLGTNLSERIMVSAGRHDIEIVNDTLGYRLTRTLQVQSGRVAAVTVEVPQGMIALNAVPWAEVWIDGEKIGETPIGNHSVAIGPHSIVFRHPELGERHHTAVVTLKEPTRLSVDLRKR
jgi:serine/threonine protein kinase